MYFLIKKASVVLQHNFQVKLTAQSLTIWVSIQVIHKVGDGVVKRGRRDAIFTLTVVHKLQPLTLVHTQEDIVVEELALGEAHQKHRERSLLQTVLGRAS